jgi:hypothetical protein
MEAKDKDIFINELKQLVEAETPLKMTLSKQRPGNHETVKALVRSVKLQNELKFTTIYRQKNKDITKNYNKKEIVDKIIELLNINFYNAVLFTDTDEWSFMQNKKNNAKITKSSNTSPVKIETTHDHQKQRWVPEESQYLYKLGLSSAEGKIYDKAQDKYRQINKYIEIIDGLTQSWENNKIYKIADMGSGKGYLTFAIFDYLVNHRGLRCVVTGYELREDLVQTCYQAALECGFMGLSFVQRSIEDITITDMDMVIALHACDIATDMAIAKGIKAMANLIIVSPCCHKQVRLSMTVPESLKPILKHGILMERQAEIVTDAIRALILESKGYKSNVFEFISSEHTGKNLMITAQKSQINTNALVEIESIKAMYGLSYHELEKHV